MAIIELAKSGRATCRTCKGKIEKDTPRVGVENVFRKDGKEYISYKWHHFDCALSKIPEIVAEADGYEILSREDRKRFDELIESLNRSPTDFIPINEVSIDHPRGNFVGHVVRVFGSRDLETPDGEVREGRIVQLQNADRRVKIIVWETKREITKGDTMYIINGEVMIGEDGNPVIHVGLAEGSHFSLNDKPKIKIVEKFISNAWERPPKKVCKFTLAKSSRATCPVCEEPIAKGSVKVIQPIWITNEDSNANFAGDRSFHPVCVEKAEHGKEIMLEAITHLTLNDLESHDSFLRQLLDQLESLELKSTLQQVLGLT
ncbi:MAG: hypothetical protein D6732_22765 [Methanobacteriota archaeon]|nr:MAG: hypothetical protein D6732_22765 [Euryarchaeota archaeon]